MSSLHSVPSQNCLRELNLFLKNVLNAFDLHSNFNALLHYSFGPRRLIEVVDTALKDEMNRAEVEFILNNLAEYAVTELRLMFRKLSLQEATDVKQRVSLAWAVWDASKKHFPEGSTQLFLKSLFDDMRLIFIEDELEERFLPSDVLLFFGKKEEEKLEEIPLSRDESFYTTVPSPTESVCPFIKQFDEGISKIKAAAEDKEEFWKNLSDYKFDKDNLLSQKNAVKMITTLFTEWDILGSDQLLSSTLTILDTICCSTDPTSRRSVFEEAQQKILAKGIPNFSKSIPNYQQRLSKCVNAISSHNSVNSNPALFESLRTELQYLVILAPKTTLQALINHCLQDRAYTPAVIKVIRGLQSMCNASVTHFQREYPLLIAVIDIIFNQSIERLNSPEFVDTLVYVLTALCRRKRVVVKEKGEEGKLLRTILGDVVEDSILNSSDIISHLAIPRMFNSKRSDVELKTMLTLLKRIFSSTGPKDTELSYTVHLKMQSSGSVPVPQLFLLIHTLLLQYENVDSDIPSLCFSVLKGLASKMTEDNVILPPETTEFLLNGLTADAWWFRYAITEWYCHPMEHPQQELPSGLFWALSEEHRGNYKEIKVDFESAPVGCLLYSLFELGLFDADLAINLLNKGLDLLPMDDFLVDQIALALCDCCAKPFFSQRLPMIFPVLERMTEIFDPRMPIPYVLDQINDNIIRAVRQLKSIQLLGRSAKIAFAKIYHHDTKYILYYPNVSLDCPKNPKEVANHLLQAYCELAKIQADKQMQLYRTLVRKRDHGNKGCLRESQRLEEQLISQLVILFHEAVIFTRFETNNPSLNVLITMLSECIKEIQSSHRDICLDKKKLQYKKTEYVYTNVKNPVTVFEGGAGDGPEPVIPENTGINCRKYSDPQYRHPSQRNNSGYPSSYERKGATNSPKSDRFSDTSSVKAAARQITHNKTRDQVVRRLNDCAHSAAPSLDNPTRKLVGRRDRRSDYQSGRSARY